MVDVEASLAAATTNFIPHQTINLNIGEKSEVMKHAEENSSDSRPSNLHGRRNNVSGNNNHNRHHNHNHHGNNYRRNYNDNRGRINRDVNRNQRNNSNNNRNKTQSRNNKTNDNQRMKDDNAISTLKDDNDGALGKKLHVSKNSYESVCEDYQVQEDSRTKSNGNKIVDETIMIHKKNKEEIIDQSKSSHHTNDTQKQKDFFEKIKESGNATTQQHQNKSVDNASASTSHGVKKGTNKKKSKNKIKKNAGNKTITEKKTTLNENVPSMDTKSDCNNELPDAVLKRGISNANENELSMNTAVLKLAPSQAISTLNVNAKSWGQSSNGSNKGGNKKGYIKDYFNSNKNSDIKIHSNDLLSNMDISLSIDKDVAISKTSKKGRNKKRNKERGESNDDKVERLNDTENSKESHVSESEGKINSNHHHHSKYVGKGERNNKGKNDQNRNNNKKRTLRKWLKLLPEGSVDPISLEPLSSLSYPPFALKISEPYEPVPTWPTRIDYDRSKPQEPPIYHLLDGRVLAYYLVSQLQFIDPLNRRDLTRPEIECLDAYLRMHKLGKAGVAEAYDNHGITISSAGQLGQTASGRNVILQQEARNILNSIFTDNRRNPGGWPSNRIQSTSQRSNVSAGHSSNTDFRNDQRRYWMDGVNQQQDSAAEDREHVTENTNNTGVASHVGGMLFIDDDANPAYRGGVQSGSSDGVVGAWASRVLSHEERVHAGSFPSLPTPAAGAQQQHQDADATTTAGEATATDTSISNATKPTSNNLSRSLQSISKIVKKTNPAKIGRQKAAREEFQHRAALANIPYTPFAQTQTINTEESVASLEAKVSRNKQLAEALGIQPSTVRINQGWARPTNVTTTTQKMNEDDFAVELQSINYAPTFLAFVKDKIRLVDVLKVEKRLRNFLIDDTSPSYSFSPMNRDLRKFVHEYGGDYWKVKTESYDLEPRRYVHCNKMMDTSMPFPLISDFIQNYSKIPAVPTIGNHPFVNDEAVTTSGNTGGRFVDFLKSNETTEIKPDILLYDNPMPRQAPQPYASNTSTLPQPSSSRASGIGSGQRVRLNLAPRTKPIEMQRLQTEKCYEYSGEIVNVEQNRIEQQKQRELQTRQNVLQKAFNSDSDDDSTSSEWEEMTPEYCSGDEF